MKEDIQRRPLGPAWAHPHMNTYIDNNTHAYMHRHPPTESDGSSLHCSVNIQNDTELFTQSLKQWQQPGW